MELGAKESLLVHNINALWYVRLKDDIPQWYKAIVPDVWLAYKPSYRHNGSIIIAHAVTKRDALGNTALREPD